MAGITAAAVKTLREKTGLPLMDCKKALNACDGNEDDAIRWLRERGAKIMGGRADRETSFGRFGIYCGTDKTAGAIVELKCESDPVARNQEFIQLANDLAEQLAVGAAATSGDELLAQPSPSQEGSTLAEQKDDLMNRIREVFNIGRFARADGPCGGYSHNSGTVAGVLVSVTGGNDEAAKDVCMHITAMCPMALNREQLDPAEVEKERSILRDAAIQEGKPESIADKMVEGQLRKFFAEKVLLDQPFVKEPKVSVGDYAKRNDMEVHKYVHWVLGEE
ncbi:MAG: translation elongation factor Ts [Pirellulaceae bacterium]